MGRAWIGAACALLGMCCSPASDDGGYELTVSADELSGGAAHADAPEADAQSCGTLDPDPELLDATLAWAARWSAAMGCAVRIEAGGVPVRAWSRVYIGSGPEAVYDSDPQLVRDEVCGATLQRPSGEVVGVFLSTRNEACDIVSSLGHEIGHTLAPPGTHALDGIGAPGDSPAQTSVITGSTLEWTCTRSACGAMRPEH